MVPSWRDGAPEPDGPDLGYPSPAKGSGDDELLDIALQVLVADLGSRSRLVMTLLQAGGSGPMKGAVSMA